MPTALTSTQLEVLRRAREGLNIYSEPRLNDTVAEIALLMRLGLLAMGPTGLSVSSHGSEYLAAAEAEALPAQSTSSSLAPPHA